MHHYRSAPAVIITCGPSTTNNPSTHHYYFAYGANMNPSTLSKRGVSVKSSYLARVVEPSIYFGVSHRSGYATLLSHKWHGSWAQLPSLVGKEEEEESEMAANKAQFSTLNPLPKYSVNLLKEDMMCYYYNQPFGLLYELRSDEDLERLRQREIGYQVVDIRIQILKERQCDHEEVVCNGTKGLNEGQLVIAKAFVSSPWLVLKRPVHPTKRYLDLLIEGAEAQGVDSEYVTWLKSLPTAEKKELSAPEYGDTMIEAAVRVIAASMTAGAVVLLLAQSL